MWLGPLILALVTLQRLCEFAFAAANARRLRAMGAVEAGAAHFWPLIGVHAVWLAGLWLLAPGAPVSPGWLAVYFALQAARAWVIAALGRRWTMRVMVIPGEKLVRAGPYRFLNHPNYAVLAGEVAVLPLVFGLWTYAALFSALNAAILFVRIRGENRALAALAGENGGSAP